MRMDKLLIKKKNKYTLQLFKDGVAITEPMKVSLWERPAIPWFGNEVIKWKHEMTISIEKFHDLTGTIPHIVIRNGDGEMLEEWHLLGVRVLRGINPDEAASERYYEIYFEYDDTIYKSYMEPLLS